MVDSMENYTHFIQYFSNNLYNLYARKLLFKNLTPDFRLQSQNNLCKFSTQLKFSKDYFLPK